MAATAKDMLKLDGVFHEVLERVVNGTLHPRLAVAGIQMIVEGGAAPDLPVVRVRFRQDVLERLLAHGILTLGQLLSFEEWPVCSKMLDCPSGTPMSNTLAREALDRFLCLRDRLDELGLDLRGERHEPSVLWANF